MKLKVLKPFGDHKENIIRQVGEVFEVSKTRFDELSASVPADFYEEVKATKAKKSEEE
ncbi:TPA: hypothetical protein ACQNWS_000754 [Streptococcus pyogenes]|uniref:Uncharacterized protein n=2 Tax=Streptococcus pyogenes TaxID=1314 RepID=A0A6C2VVG0_STRPY|nr:MULTISPECIES: hypothetical protein [Streptococcus]NP_795406.1 hypothetical protein SpyM3_0714 [Streptococcus phage 315.1]ESU90584.1 hypothetical protein HMPREF1243_0543 [Streptococcus pyogenes GA03747]QBX14411.1 hypothetical protein Javan137_0024 [Streptococcus phage Javan137]QBX19262.1 hypothetical protein Javan477_0036 [Streptococcus phage Javan477]QBX20067.1 hypothetical protein Javan507_0036 [Streptococcus phage Javan507]QBX20450.1 hypothetical protein Javan521_0038 [Streptococcus phag